MIRRARKVSFRLTFEEEERLKPLMQSMHCWSLSELVRVALRRLDAQEQERQRPIISSDKSADVGRPVRTSDNGKKKKVGTTRPGRKTLKK
jgi:Arc/MetJ-type ribon-helix-helix transcriptional regulator